MLKRILLSVFLCGTVVATNTLWLNDVTAYTTINVPVTDSVYRAIDIFTALNLTKDVITGQRPYTRSEVGRVLRSVKNKLAEHTIGENISKFSYAKTLLNKYLSEYHDEIEDCSPKIKLETLKKMNFITLYNSSKPEAYLDGLGTGSIDGLITSFDAYQEGRTYQNGSNIFLITEHNLQLTKYFALSVRPQFECTYLTSGNGNCTAQLLNLYGKAGFKNIELEVGRDSILLGQGEFGGLLLTSNARPLDMIKVTNPHPWRPPWIFKYLGPTKFTFFVSNLGPEYHYPYAYFYGMKATIRPLEILEFGIAETVIMGGDGSPKVTFTDILNETFPIFKAGHNINYQDTSNHLFGIFDLRLTIPPLRNTILYWDSFFDDSPLRAIGNLDNILNQMSFTAGVYIPRVSNSGSMNLRVEYQHISPYSYRHGTWTSGYTLDRRLLGSNLGPDGDAIYTTFKWSPNNNITTFAKLEFEHRNSNTYYITTNATGGGEKLLVASHNPDENRYRIILGSDWDINNRFTISPVLGYEYITNTNFSTGQSTNNALVGLSLSLKFENLSVVKP